MHSNHSNNINWNSNLYVFTRRMGFLGGELAQKRIGWFALIRFNYIETIYIYIYSEHSVLSKSCGWLIANTSNLHRLSTFINIRASASNCTLQTRNVKFWVNQSQSGYYQFVCTESSYMRDMAVCYLWFIVLLQYLSSYIYIYFSFIRFINKP